MHRLQESGHTINVDPIFTAEADHVFSGHLLSIVAKALITWPDIR